jgi:UDP-glucose 4-epimerase
MQTVWVTGIAGFLGSAVARRFLQDGWRVAGAGNLRTGDAVDLPLSKVGGRVALSAGPISAESLENLLAIAGAPDLVVHAAGSGAVGPSFADPFRDFDRAVGSTAILLEFLRRKAPRSRLVLASSAAVYGVRPEGPLAETLESQPASPYGAHKQMAEVLCRQAERSFGQPVAIIRFFSLYGPPLRKQLLWDLSCRLAGRPESLTLAGSGDETRDLLYVDDAVELIRTVAARPEPFLLVNGGTGVATRVRQIAGGLIRRLSPGTALGFDGMVRAGDPRHLCADTGVSRAVGFAAGTGLDEGLDRYAEWFRREGVTP